MTLRQLGDDAVAERPPRVDDGHADECGERDDGQAAKQRHGDAIRR
jgi:hypothetical protein